MLENLEAVATQPGTNIPTTTETVAATSPAVKIDKPKQRVLVLAVANIFTGAGTTVLTPRIRRTSIAGPILNGSIGQAAAAGVGESVVAFAVDEVQDVSTVTYVLTVGQSGASGNGTVQQSAILVIPI